MLRRILLLVAALLALPATAQTSFSTATIASGEKSHNPPRVSCGVRGHMPWRNAAIGAATYRFSRWAEKTNVSCSAPQFYYYFGIGTYQGGSLNASISGNTLHVNYITMGKLFLGEWIGGVNATGHTMSAVTNGSTTVTVTTADAHNLVAGNLINVTGFTPTTYNISGAPVNVIDATHFSYSVVTAPSTQPSVFGSYVVSNAQITAIPNAGTDALGTAGDFTLTGDAVTVASSALTMTGSANSSFTSLGLEEAPAGQALIVRCGLLTGTSGTAQNQTTATPHQCTWFDMLRVPGFVAAGGSVTSDGTRITVPGGGWLVHTDPFAGISLAPQEHYIVQTEMTGATTANIPYGDGIDASQSDFNASYSSLSAAGANVYSVNPASGGSVTISMNPIAVIGNGLAGAKCIGIVGDSIGHGVNGGGGTLDTGDADAVKGGIKKSLNAAGYCYVDTTISGTNVGQMFATRSDPVISYAARAAVLGLPTLGAVLDEHVHNDQGAGWDTVYPQYQWWWSILRKAATSGSRLIKTVATPTTNSTNTSVFTPLTNWVYVNLRPYLRGYLPGGGQAPDGMFDMYAAIGAYDGSGNPTGFFASSTYTADGTHPSSTGHTQVASYFSSDRLKSIFGF